MLILAIDTALTACQAALVRDGEALAVRSEPMERGHQERLGPMVEALFHEAGVQPREVDRVAVTLGPGSFTGLRVGIAFAKGVALGLGKPLVGVGTLQALAAGSSGRCAAVIAAPHGRVYCQAFAKGRAVEEPSIEETDDAVARLRGQVDRVVGPAVEAFADALGVPADPIAYPNPVAVARLGGEGVASGAPLRPLYLREPDAKTIAERAALKAVVPS